ncbi:MAG: FAD-linked oxidase C-terminal domain-containing protein [Desulfarculaceae bacterium]|jgi:glycolate oxidase subunit GlcD
MEESAKKALIAAAGKENFTQAPEQRLLYASDAAGHVQPHLPQAVIRARDAEQIARVMAACTAHRIPIVPRGAGSGLTGGAVPIAGGVVLDMAGLNRILSINTADQNAVVEPGVVTAELQAAVEAKGYFYPPDPASVSFCTIGGNVAENAGGLRAVKYGVTRDYVLGLTAVLPNGRVFKSGGANLKSVVGYDLTRLLVGSEGTLAVMTEIILRILPLPEAKRTLNGYFRKLEQSAQAVQAILASGIKPVACEFIDTESLMAVADFVEVDVGAGYEAMILIDIDGPPEVVDRQARDAVRILADSGADPVRLAQDRAEADVLWRARRALGPATLKLGSGKLNEDVGVPLSQLGQVVRRMQQVAKHRGLRIPVFGHAGDGNLHVNIMYDKDDIDQEKRAHEALTDVFAHVLNLGGTLSGEHGVGLAKLGFVGAEIDPVALELMRGIKKVFDPAGILNPHKKIPSPQALI